MRIIKMRRPFPRSEDIRDEERDGNPHVWVFPAWNAQWVEDYVVTTSVVEAIHSRGRLMWTLTSPNRGKEK